MNKNPSHPTFKTSGLLDVGPIFPPSHELQLGEVHIDPHSRFFFCCAPALVQLHSIGMLHGDLDAEQFLFDIRTGNAFLLDFATVCYCELNPAAMATDFKIAAATMSAENFHALLAGYIQESLLFLDSRRRDYTAELLEQIGGAVTYMPWPEAKYPDIEKTLDHSKLEMRLSDGRLRLDSSARLPLDDELTKLAACLCAFGIAEHDIVAAPSEPFSKFFSWMHENRRKGAESPHQPDHFAVKALLDSVRSMPVEKRLELAELLIDISDFVAAKADSLANEAQGHEGREQLETLSRNFAQLTLMLFQASMTSFDRDESRILFLIRRHHNISWVPSLLEESLPDNLLPYISYAHSRALTFLKLFVNTLGPAMMAEINPAWSLLYRSLGISRTALLSLRRCLEGSAREVSGYQDNFDQIVGNVLDLLISALMRYKDATLPPSGFHPKVVTTLQQLADEVTLLIDLKRHIDAGSLADKQGRDLLIKATTPYEKLAWQWR